MELFNKAFMHVCMLPDFHNFCSESGAKAMHTVHADKQCYQ